MYVYYTYIHRNIIIYDMTDDTDTKAPHLYSTYLYIYIYICIHIYICMYIYICIYIYIYIHMYGEMNRVYIQKQGAPAAAGCAGL